MPTGASRGSCSSSRSSSHRRRRHRLQPLRPPRRCPAIASPTPMRIGEGCGRQSPLGVNALLIGAPGRAVPPRSSARTRRRVRLSRLTHRPAVAGSARSWTASGPADRVHSMRVPNSVMSRSAMSARRAHPGALAGRSMVTVGHRWSTSERGGRCPDRCARRPARRRRRPGPAPRAGLGSRPRHEPARRPSGPRAGAPQPPRCRPRRPRRGRGEASPDACARRPGQEDALIAVSWLSRSATTLPGRGACRSIRSRSGPQPRPVPPPPPPDARRGGSPATW
jgi:hypothetical protein